MPGTKTPMVTGNLLAANSLDAEEICVRSANESERDRADKPATSAPHGMLFILMIN